jgi:hypothetical protein
MFTRKPRSKFAVPATVQVESARHKSDDIAAVASTPSKIPKYIFAPNDFVERVFPTHTIHDAAEPVRVSYPNRRD